MLVLVAILMVVVYFTFVLYKHSGRFILWFAIAGIIAPSIEGLFFLFPQLYPFRTLGTADKTFEIFIFVLWPMFYTTAMGTDIGGKKAIIVYAVGALMNVGWYAFLGADLWNVSQGYLRRTLHK